MEPANQLFESLRTTRVVILLETAPQSDEFGQIMMTMDEFKMFTEFMFEKVLTPVPGEKFHRAICTDWTIPIKVNGMNDFYSRSEIGNFSPASSMTNT